MISCRYRTWLETGRAADLEPELDALLPGLYRKARGLLRQDADAKDAVQDAMIVLLSSRERLPREVPLAAIVHRLVTQRSLMFARAQQRRRRRESGMIGEAARW